MSKGRFFCSMKKQKMRKKKNVGGEFIVFWECLDSEFISAYPPQTKFLCLKIEKQLNFHTNNTENSVATEEK